MEEDFMGTKELEIFGISSFTFVLSCLVSVFKLSETMPASFNGVFPL